MDGHILERNAGDIDTVAYYRRECDINVMPLRTDGSKAPKIGWLGWQLERVPAGLLREYFEKPSGIGGICGATSGDLEDMDFDDPRMWDPWLAVVEVYYPGLLEHAPVVLTPSGGRHVFYRCDEIEGNLKLAYQADGTIGIETRGQGGQAVLPGSPPGTHKSGGTYRLISGDFARIPRVTPRERQRLLEVARSQDERAPKPVVDLQDMYGFAPTFTETGIGDGNGNRPGDDFNARAEWEDILEQKGWSWLRTSSGVSYWRRPDKTGTGPSATTGYCGDKLHVFSSSCLPLEADQTYSKFAVYAHLYCDGDYRYAARSLAGLGFGDHTTDQQEDNLISTIERVRNG